MTGLGADSADAETVLQREHERSADISGYAGCRERRYDAGTSSIQADQMDAPRHARKHDGT